MSEREKKRRKREKKVIRYNMKCEQSGIHRIVRAKPSQATTA